MFKDVSVLDDVSYGQRGYLRNQEGLLNILKENNTKVVKNKNESKGHTQKKDNMDQNEGESK